ncbi:Maf family protein [Gloeobacter kilaueensis]|uniref:dTTP/UTP pyrophosphatase n=1 Tax=Gloeobacter kilaueensis (strain ATCC BAA-2537 / CCAP 1431/1 / ULC 316 / JS1) TaxID=1183438 RepID=U5QDF9_GLOK1|nr:Maf family protein [Gloeobacter kilaueensis]AGY56873.1 septum formation protein Maf [Gloeobacter kilaueensis JS1]
MAVHLVLASASPRRRELLQQLGIVFECLPSAYTEQMDPAAPPEQLVVANALGKALAVQPQRLDCLILGADTIVVLEGKIYGKPESPAEAEQMLAQLQGRWHTVYTGIALVEQQRKQTAVRATGVRLRNLKADEIAAYVASGEPLDKAGSYAIQGLGAGLVSAIDGCYTNVVGLSLPLLVDLLTAFGRSLF